MTHSEMVAQFHRALGIPIGTEPTAAIPPDRQALRVALIEEELQEYRDALAAGDTVEVADALIDLLVVVHGAALEHGLPVDDLFAEVHRSNMAKVGGPVRADGKILKPAGWTPPQIARVLATE